MTLYMPAEHGRTRVVIRRRVAPQAGAGLPWRVTPRSAAVGALLLVTAVWGVAYVIVKDALEHMPPSDFLAWRFAVAVCVLALLRPVELRGLTPTDLRAGALVGVPLAAGYLLQTVGLLSTSAAVSGFLTGLLVVFVPLFAACLFRRRLTGEVLAGVTVATAGLAVLCLDALSVGWGELLTVLGAAAFAVHVLALARYARGHALSALVFVQLAVVASVSLMLAADGGLAMPGSGEVWFAIVVTALPCTALAYWLQTWAQRRLSATSTAVVLTSEPLFAGLAAVWLGGEVLGPRVLLGGALIVTAMLLVEVAPRRRLSAPLAVPVQATAPDTRPARARTERHMVGEAV